MSSAHPPRAGASASSTSGVAGRRLFVALVSVLYRMYCIACTPVRGCVWCALRLSRCTAAGAARGGSVRGGTAGLVRGGSPGVAGAHMGGLAGSFKRSSWNAMQVSRGSSGQGEQGWPEAGEAGLGCLAVTSRLEGTQGMTRAAGAPRACACCLVPRSRGVSAAGCMMGARGSRWSTCVIRGLAMCGLTADGGGGAQHARAPLTHAWQRA
jgi:hypothetical protein